MFSLPQLHPITPSLATAHLKADGAIMVSVKGIEEEGGIGAGVCRETALGVAE